MDVLAGVISIKDMRCSFSAILHVARERWTSVFQDKFEVTLEEFVLGLSRGESDLDFLWQQVFWLLAGRMDHFMQQSVHGESQPKG